MNAYTADPRILFLQGSIARMKREIELLRADNARLQAKVDGIDLTGRAAKLQVAAMRGERDLLWLQLEEAKQSIRTLQQMQ
jgi:hypothetical protein